MMSLIVITLCEQGRKLIFIKQYLLSEIHHILYVFLYLGAKERKLLPGVCILFSELFYLDVESEEGIELVGMHAAAAGLINPE
jgi:hypothetical protein